MILIKSFRFWIGIIVSGLCFWLALRDVPFADLSRSLATAQYWWLVPAAIFQLLSVAGRAQRWVVLLGKDPRFADSFWSQGIGYLFTNIFPFRLGEAARVVVMAERCRQPVVQVGMSALIERLLDVLMVVLMLVLVLPWMEVPTLVSQAGLSFGIVVLFAITALLLIVRFNSRSEKVLRTICLRIEFLPAKHIIRYWRQIVAGLLPLTQWKTASEAVIWSIISWAAGAMVYWLVLHSFQADSTPVEAAFMLVTLSFAVTMPSSPGFIGVFQLVGQQALVLPFGGKYDLTTSLAIALTIHLTYYLLTTLLGLIGLWRLGESFGNLGRSIAARRAVGKTIPQEIA